MCPKQTTRAPGLTVSTTTAARVLMRGLAENAVIILLPDQAVLPREGVLAPFLGYPAWTTPAPAKMAIRAGSTIVFGFCIPDGLRTRVEFQESYRRGLLGNVAVIVCAEPQGFGVVLEGHRNHGRCDCRRRQFLLRHF